MTEPLSHIPAWGWFALYLLSLAIAALACAFFWGTQPTAEEEAEDELLPACSAQRRRRADPMPRPALLRALAPMPIGELARLANLDDAARQTLIARCDADRGPRDLVPRVRAAFALLISDRLEKGELMWTGGTLRERAP